MKARTPDESARRMVPTAGPSGEISFTVPLIPAAKGRPRFARFGGFVRTFTPAKTETAERNLVAIAAPYAPAAPLEGPVAIALTFLFPIPTSWPKWKQHAAAAGAVEHTSKPDLDNLQKLVLDGLTSTGRWWRDDAQVASVESHKGYGTAPATVIRIRPLEQTSAAQWKARAAS